MHLNSLRGASRDEIFDLLGTPNGALRFNILRKAEPDYIPDLSTNSYQDPHKKLILKAINLDGVNLTHTNIYQSILNEANCRGANFYLARFENGTAEKTDFTDANFHAFNIRETSFKGSNFSGVHFKHTEAWKAVFDEAVFDERTNFGESDFTQASFKNVDFRKVKTENIISTSFRSANFRGATFSSQDQIDILRASNAYLDENPIIQPLTPAQTVSDPVTPASTVNHPQTTLTATPTTHGTGELLADKPFVVDSSVGAAMHRKAAIVAQAAQSGPKPFIDRAVKGFGMDSSRS